jgi:hypothetical protein
MPEIRVRLEVFLTMGAYRFVNVTRGVGLTLLVQEGGVQRATATTSVTSVLPVDARH